jgi:hypothetical protein
MVTATPEVNTLVEVRGHRWVVSELDATPMGASTVVTLQSVEDDRYGETLDVVWEVEPGRRILPAGSLPDVSTGRFDAPHRLAAFLDAVRWSAVTSADTTLLQAPFRSGVAIEDYQLEPVARAVEAPAVNLLLADDVGLGKTIEAGLVAQELLLRHRARRIMIVCPAGLTTKWRDEMAEKFGLDFLVVDSAQCATLRRTHGSAANPFRAYPLVIVSLAWLRGPRAQRLLDEVLPADGPSELPTFDLLILDEAHHVAPAAPKQEYAVDSQQTKLLRLPRAALRPPAVPVRHAAQRVPNLLHRPAGDHRPPPVRPRRGPRRGGAQGHGGARLKRDIVNADGTPRFVERTAKALPVAYPEDERGVHRLLTEFAALRRKRLRAQRGQRAIDLVTLLLKKLLFSSPAAFAHTVACTARRCSPAPPPALPPPSPGSTRTSGSTSSSTKPPRSTTTSWARRRTTPSTFPAGITPQATAEELALLRQLDNWARAHEGRPDAKAKQLLTFLDAVCRPDGKWWTNERVVIFTEYGDTQLWLEQQLRSHGLGEERLALLYGGMAADERELLRLAFQADPAEHPVRILLATDAASEGIDLQNHCHRLVNFEIPFNRTNSSSASAASTGTVRSTPRRSSTSSASVGRRPPTPTRPIWSSCPGWPRKSPTWKPTWAGSTPRWPRRCRTGCWGGWTAGSASRQRRRPSQSSAGATAGR